VAGGRNSAVERNRNSEVGGHLPRKHSAGEELFGRLDLAFGHLSQLLVPHHLPSGVFALGKDVKYDYLLSNPTIRNAKAIVSSTTRQR
jgi:hypothetical protein